MFDQAILIPSRRLPWIKITFFGVAVTGVVGIGVYALTSKTASASNEIELTQKNVSILDVKRAHEKEKEAEQEKCDKQRIWIGGKLGCVKEY